MNEWDVHGPMLTDRSLHRSIAHRLGSFGLVPAPPIYWRPTSGRELLAAGVRLEAATSATLSARRESVN